MKKGYTLIEIVVVVVFVGVLCLFPLYIFWTDTNLDYIVSAIKGHAVNVPIWLSAIFAIVTNGFGMLFNIIVSIIRTVK